MAFMSIVFLGVKLWIWLYFIFSIVLGLAVLIYIKREVIRNKWYKFRYPEKILKIVIHYKTGLYRVYWRLIPDSDHFEIESKKYNYIEEDSINERKTPNIELHYWFNVPQPIKFEMERKQIKLSSKQEQQFKENDLFGKLLTLDEEKRLIIFVLIIAGLNLLATGFIIAKIMGYIK